MAKSKKKPAKAPVRKKAKVKADPPREGKEIQAYRPRKAGKERFSKMANVKNKRNKPVWDLDRDGITYSLLSRFMVCPERFRLSTVEGWSETGISAGLEFGSAFHRALEHADTDPRIAVAQYQRERLAKGHILPHQRQEYETLMASVEATVLAYRTYWRKSDVERAAVIREETWDIQYPLPVPATMSFFPGDPEDYGIHHGMSQENIVERKIRLRGRFDEVFRNLKTGKLWLLETKTKSDIDYDGLNRTLSQDLQTMLYVTAIEHLTGETVEGVVYNVVRRPSLKFTPKDGTLDGFAKRVQKTILEQSDKYFYRFRCELDEGQLREWQKRTLHPLLTQVVLWWDSIKNDPFDPWGSPLHYQRPFGCYDALASGRRGDFFELLTGGLTGKLRRRSTAFPELEGDD